jgi:hypothetical protein
VKAEHRNYLCFNSRLCSAESNEELKERFMLKSQQRGIQPAWSWLASKQQEV